MAADCKKKYFILIYRGIMLDNRICLENTINISIQG